MFEIRWVSNDSFSNIHLTAISVPTSGVFFNRAMQAKAGRARA